MHQFENVLSWFQFNFQDLVANMKACTHHYDIENLNPYHLEGDIWTHTMMVVSHSLRLTSNHNVHLAALLHDVDKVGARKLLEDKKRVAFYNHEQLSTIKAIAILDKLMVDLPNYTFNEHVLKLVNWHSDFHRMGELREGELFISQKEIDNLNKKFGNDLSLFEELVSMSKSDTYGRVHSESEDNAKLEELKFKFLDSFIPYPLYLEPTQTQTCECIMLVGLPACGKSTLIEELQKEKEYVVLSSDNLIVEMFPHLSYNESFRKVVKEDLFKNVELTIKKQLNQAVSERKNIILDRTNLTKKSRGKLLSYVPDKYYVKKAFVFLVSLDTLNSRNVERNKNDGKFISHEAYHNMSSSFYLPDNSEFQKIQYVFEHQQTKKNRTKEIKNIQSSSIHKSNKI